MRKSCASHAEDPRIVPQRTPFLLAALVAVHASAPGELCIRRKAVQPELQHKTGRLPTALIRESAGRTSAAPGCRPAPQDRGPSHRLGLGVLRQDAGGLQLQLLLEAREVLGLRRRRMRLRGARRAERICKRGATCFVTLPHPCRLCDWRRADCRSSCT